MKLHYRLIGLVVCCNAFEMPNLNNVFKPPSGGGASSSSVQEIKAQLLEAVSFTANGKDATPEQQSRVLSIVRDLETRFPVSPTLLSNQSELQAVDGTWFLQYTSPSTLEDTDEVPVRTVSAIIYSCCVVT